MSIVRNSSSKKASQKAQHISEKIKTVTALPGEEKVIAFGPVILDIPVGAVDAPVDISIEMLQAVNGLNPGLNNTTEGASGYRFKPDGMKFLKPVKVTIPYDKKAVLPDELANLHTYFYDEAQCGWERLERVGIDRDEGTVTSLTVHFTDMINGVLALPETARPLSFNPNSIKEIKVANPGAGINLIEPPQANNQGTATLSYPIEVPPACKEMQPKLVVQYNSESGNGWLGMGWDIPMSAISVDTRWGVPRYSEENETETYLLDGMELTPVAHRGIPEPRVHLDNEETYKVFHTRVESDFRRIIRLGDYPQDYRWQVTDKNGTVYVYGDRYNFDPYVLQDEYGPIFRWYLQMCYDTNGNVISYNYEKVNDSGIGDGTGGVQGVQVYLKSITYSDYEVKFIRDRDLSEPRRSDIIIDGRPGFKVVTCDLLRRVEVSYIPYYEAREPIRSYELQYQAGAFQKTLLSRIIQYGQDGSEFNRHEFTYFDEVRDGEVYNGFATPVAWETGNDHIALGMPGTEGKASVIGGSKGGSGGSHIYLGVGWQPAKAASIGYKIGSSHSSGEEIIAFVDLNGDGLPDKIFKKDGVVWFRSNNGPAEAPVFSEPVALNIASIGQESSAASSSGSEVYVGGVSHMNNTCRAVTTSHIYFSDVNGDGLPDLVMDGKVYFNRLVDGMPTFIADDSQGTPVPVPPSALDTDSLVRDYTEEYNAMLDASPLLDALRVWRAPFAGQVTLNAPVRLVEVNRGTYQTADGVRVAIQRNGSELWHANIGANDYTWRTPTGVASVSVQKGDRIYFRVSSVFDGAFDQVEWDPEISYLNVNTGLTDANGLTPYRYKASQDFTCAGRGGSLQMPFAGKIKIDGDLVKLGVTSDDIRLSVAINDAGVIARELAWDTAGTIFMGDEIDVLEGDRLTVKVATDSPIDLKQIDWKPEVYYTETTDPGIVLADSDGNPTIRVAVYCDHDIYQPASPGTAQSSWTATKTGVLTVLPQVTLSGAPVTAGKITFTVKKLSELVEKQELAIVNGVLQPPAEFTLDVVAGEQLYFDFSSSQPELNGYVTHSVRVSYPPASPVTAPSTFYCQLVPSPNSLPKLYRSWGYVAYNGNRARYAQPINENDLIITEAYGQTSFPQVFLLIPDYAGQRWVSKDSECWIAASGMSSSRSGTNYIAMPQGAGTAGVRAVNRMGSARLSTSSTGAFYATISDSSGTSYGELDFLDMNGDGFPDIVGNGRIQYTTPTGALEGSNTAVEGFSGTIRGSANHARIGGIGGNPLESEVKADGKNQRIERLMPSLGVSLNLVDEESASCTKDMMDINGDGLPDQVWMDDDNIMVSLNLGYRFAEPEVWGSGAIMQSSSEQQPLSVSPGLGFVVGSANDGIYSFAGGVSYNSSRSKVSRYFADINGDGLPDMVIKNDSTMYVAFNMGNGFAPPVEWRGAPMGRYFNEAKSSQQGGGLYLTFAIPIPLGASVIYIIVNPGGDSGTYAGWRETGLMDVTGDGCPDFVVAGSNDQIQVYRNKVGLTNKLHSVARPLGASFELSYHREGNTYDLPQRKWVLGRVALQDGYAGDGVDSQLVTYKYSGGKYDRLERDFYGFRQVTTEYRDPTDNSLLKSVVVSYLNDCFYTKGLVESVETMDGGGNLYLKTVSQYRLLDVDTGTDFVNTYPGNTIATVFPQLVRTDKFFYEGQAAPGVSTYQTFEYDQYGDVTRYYDAGNIGGGDDIESLVTYHHDQEKHIIGKPKTVKAYSNGELLRHREAEYDQYGNMVELRCYLADGKASVTNFTYYFSGLLLLTENSGGVDVSDYDGSGGMLASVTGPANANGDRYTVWYCYGIGPHVIRIADSFGYESAADYNYYFGVPTSTTDINGNITRKEYDKFGRLTKVFSPYDGNVPAAAFEYYPHEAVPRAVTQNKLHFNPLSGETLDTILFTDGLNRVIQTKKEAEVLLAGQITATYGMAVSGKVLFDALGRVTQQGQVVFEAGYSTTLADSVMKNAVTTAYDVLNRPTLVTLPDDSTITTVYGIEAGRLKTTVTDPEDKVKHSYRDVRGNTAKVVQYNFGQAITTAYSYDPLGQILTVRDELGNVTSMSYDMLGRRTSLDNPDRGVVEYAYDLAGNLVRRVDAGLRAKGVAIDYSYRYNRLEKIHYPESPDVEYSYGHPGDVHNRAGRVYRVIDAAGVTETCYGRLGEATRMVRTVNFGLPGQEPWTFVTETGYDYLGRMAWMTYPDGEKVTYTYDKGGLVKSAYGTKGPDRFDYVSGIYYDEFGQRLRVVYGNGVQTDYTYDVNRRWLQTILTENAAGERLQDTLMTHDRNGNILATDNPAAGVIQNYWHDDLQQLIKAEGTSQEGGSTNHYLQTFEYDAVGNMLQKTSVNEIAPGGAMPAALNYDLTYEYASGRPHAPSKIGGWDCSYDVNGNVVKREQDSAMTEYFWNEENRLLRAKVNDAITEFGYDAGGDRTVKRGPLGETLYVSQFYQIANRDKITKHVYVGPARVVSKLARYSTPNRLFDPDYEAVNTFTYHPDHIGSTTFITNSAGAKVEHIEYAPYGEAWIEEGTSMLDYRFTGKEFDSETGLYYFGARYFDPQASIWLSPDPAGQGINWYMYCNNNPLKYIDPDGLENFDTTLNPSLKQGPAVPNFSLSSEAAASFRTNLSEDRFKANLSPALLQEASYTLEHSSIISDNVPGAIKSVVTGAVDAAFGEKLAQMNPYKTTVTTVPPLGHAMELETITTQRVKLTLGLKSISKGIGPAAIGLLGYDVYKNMTEYEGTNLKKAISYDLTGSAVIIGGSFFLSTAGIAPLAVLGIGVVAGFAVDKGVSYLKETQLEKKH